MKTNDRHLIDIVIELLTNDIEPIEVAIKAITHDELFGAEISNFGSVELNERFAHFRRIHLKYRESEMVILFMMKNKMQIPAEVYSLYRVRTKEHDDSIKMFFPLLVEEKLAMREASLA